MSAGVQAAEWIPGSTGMTENGLGMVPSGANVTKQG